MIAEKIGLAAMLTQTAEECGELNVACLKLERIIRGENKTPVSEDDALDAVTEEIADVQVCVGELTRALGISLADIDEIMTRKIDRARERLK